jgi:predicted nucleic acid-binding protein
MAFKVNADVVDLRSDIPKNTDVFFVDTNIWYWFGYPPATVDPDLKPHRKMLISQYLKYINIAKQSSSRLYKCTLSFSELAHIIESNERKIFNRNNNLDIEAKNFRHNYPQERAKVFTEIEDIWNLVNSVTGNNTIEANITDNLVDESLKRLKNEALDGYDAFMIEAMIASGITHVITDDRDFGQVAGITVFTANMALINEATKQNKLVPR